MSVSADTGFPDIRFAGQLRPSQQEAVRVAEQNLAEGKHRLHIVAPPGTGKTVLGLYLWAHCVKKPALVLSPNSAIQAQWAARVSLFHNDSDGRPSISTDSKSPAHLTSLTYQSVTLPRRADEELDELALERWLEMLVAAGEASDPEEAQIWIDDLRRHNKEHFEDRLAAYRKDVRDERALGGEALQMLHASSLATLHRLKDFGIGLVILDECHHLMGHWGRVLADAHDLLDEPVILGLTATPPDRQGKQVEDVQRYDEFFGPVDYEVPVPAVVKDGYLAPFQDLAYFVRPEPQELTFIANSDDEIFEITQEVCRPFATEDFVPQGDFANAGQDAATSEGATAASDSIETESSQEEGNLSAESHGPASAENPGPTAAAEQADQKETPNSAARRENLIDWLKRILHERRLPTGTFKEWSTFERRDPEFILAARQFLLQRGMELPDEVPLPTIELPPDEPIDFDTLVLVLDRYVRHRLRRSPDPEDHSLAQRVIRRLRTVGVQITDAGIRACASPVGRVMAYSKAKAQALLPILHAEIDHLGDGIRAVVVTDFEKTSAVSSEVEHLLDEEAGGAVAAFRLLVSDPRCDLLDPILMTGSSVLVDDELPEPLVAEAKAWLETQQLDVEFEFDHEDGFAVLRGRGGDWSPKVYVSMITHLFQKGVSKCLVGTRGLLGEGWDAHKVNVLIDLTTVTTSMTVNQLRGRSIRLDPDDPQKLADNWDVVCIAPEFVKGLDDYRRFIAKHKTLFGVTDDGVIEKGVGHVHAAFTELKPEGVEGSTEALNADMLARVSRRTDFRALWRIGEPYQGKPLRAVEVKRPMGRTGGFPAIKGKREAWSHHSLAQAVGKAVLGAMIQTKMVSFQCDVQVGERAGDYVRIWLDDADDAEAELFATAVHEALGPLKRPRYVIPRFVELKRQTWLSKLLPEVVGRFFERRDRKLTMLHAVPSCFARNRELADVYSRHWNRHVSPGEPAFAFRGEGKRMVETAAEKGYLASASVHDKRMFV